MFTDNKLILRIGVGKALGLVAGGVGFICLPMLVTGVTTMLQFAVLFWYITFGAIIGVFGVFSYHPVLKIPFPWWLRGAVLGAWLNFVITLFAYDQIAVLTAGMFGEYAVFTSPYWMVLEGAILGLLFDFLLTHWFGEGSKLIREPALMGS